MHKNVVRLLLLLSAGAFLIACGQSSPVSGGGSSSSRLIRVLSNRADLISGGDALIEVVLSGHAPSEARVSLNGTDVTRRFSLDPQSRFVGLIAGMSVGTNTITATVGDEIGSATLVNHPSGGPLFAGPQLQPWTCQSAAVDTQCNQAPAYRYFYLSSNALKVGLQPYDPAKPAADVAQTTTDQGATLPFIVREEIGYLDRDQYAIAVLYQPGQDWSAVQPQKQFNHKLVIMHGHACGVAYQAGTAPSVLSYAPANVLGLAGINLSLPTQIIPDSAIHALGRGYAVMSTALDNSDHNCNVALQAESLIMAKEHLVEAYGTLRYTIGTGCSGGSLAQQQIANAYPGIYQGVVITCSFPDAWSTATQFADYHLLLNYFNDSSKWAAGVSWPEPQQAAVMGHISTLNANVSESAQFHVAVPTDHCSGINAQDRYDAKSNPGGVRCTITDAAINLLGPRPPELWTDSEKTAGHGFAGFPVDNVGVQYGLSALKSGQISAAQFVDLNLKIGGLDVDTNGTASRTAAVEPALAYAYRAGMINETTNYDQTAIIDCRGPDPGLFHDAYRAFAIRARLDAAHGSHANQVIWEGPFLIVGDTACNVNGLDAMDRWLSAVEIDLGNAAIAAKLVADKPGDIGDACWSGIGVKLGDRLCGEAVVPILATPRIVAGDAITTDTNKCQLKPLDRAGDYGAVTFTGAQWAQLQELFKDGVCDFSKPGVDQQPTIAWQTYEGNGGAVLYGGTPLPVAPPNSGGGLAGPAFAPFQ